MITFAYPLAFCLLLLPIIVRLLTPIVQGMHGDALEVPSSYMRAVKTIETKSGTLLGIKTASINKNTTKLAFFYLIYALVVSAVARPQIVGEPIPIRNYNREILMVLDISNSMLETDFTIGNRRVTRLYAVKKTISEFMENRKNDKIGLILFATNAYLQAPITYDKKSVEEILMTVDAGMAGESTAIGDALGLALKTLRKSGDLDKKVIILLTDGENNDGSLNMAEAISLAQQEGIKIYTIGVGSDGSLFQSIFGFNLKLGNSGIDEKSLQEIADATKGTYFRANETKALERIYRTIDSLEPNENEDIYVQEIQELYYAPLILALLLSGILILLSRRTKL